MSDEVKNKPNFDTSVLDQTESIQEQISDPNEILNKAVEEQVDLDKKEPISHEIKPSQAIRRQPSFQDSVKLTEKVTINPEETPVKNNPKKKNPLKEEIKPPVNDEEKITSTITEDTIPAVEVSEENKEKIETSILESNEEKTDENKDPTTFVLESELHKEDTVNDESEEDEEEADDEEETDVTIPHLDLSKEDEEAKENIVPEFAIDEHGEIKTTEETKNENTEKEKPKPDSNVLEKRIAKRTNTEMHGFGVDDIMSSVSSENQVLKKLKKYDIPPEKIVAINSSEESTHQAFLKQYMSPSLSPIVAPRISRFPLLLSGYYAEMRNYTYGEHTSVIKNATNPDLKYANRLQEELISLFQHITWTSLPTDSKNPMDFDRWISVTKFPDLEQFYYGAFDATYPGETNYRVTCGVESCQTEFSVVKNNRELNYTLRKDLSAKFIRDILLEKVSVAELKNTSVYKEANTLYEEKVLPDIHFKISYSVPTIRDVLEWLTVFDDLLSNVYEDFNGLVDDSPEHPEHNVLKLFTYIAKVTCPVVIGQDDKGRDILRFYCVDGVIEDSTEKRVANKKQILTLIKDLDKDIFRELFTGKEVANKIHLVGITHMLQNIQCPNCGTNLIRIPIDMADTFFMEVARTQRAISHY